MKGTSWDPDSLHSPNQKDFLAPEPELDHILFGQAKPLTVPVLLRDVFCGGYIDGRVYIPLDLDNNIKDYRTLLPLQSTLYFSHLILRNQQIETTLSLSLYLNKQWRVHQLNRKIIGWLLHTRLFKIFLPLDKASEWISDIKDLLNNGEIAMIAQLVKCET